MNYLFRPQDLPPKIPYEKIFNQLPSFADDTRKKRGRPAFSKDAILRALIYKCLRGLPSLSELAFELKNNLVLAETLGFPAFKTPPSIERFSHFLRNTANERLQTFRRSLVQLLIEEKVIIGKVIAMDSCTIEANVRENNLKTSMVSRFDKSRNPSGDPEAKLGVKIYYPKSSKKRFTYYWEYRNHILTDALSELPLHETTLTAERHEQKQAVPMLRNLTEHFKLPVESVTADANYDTEEILSYIFHEMKAMPVIPKNPRATRKDNFIVKKNTIICPANLEMYRRGKMNSRGRIYLQYSCPLYYGKKYKGQFLVCPASHPKYFLQKGCNHLLRLSPTVRKYIDYNSQRFKEIYNQRTSVERVFSRLLKITMLRPSVVGLRATQNHCTVAHITVLLIALAAHRSGADDKIRFVKTFLPNLTL
jgi:transposase